MAVVRTEIPADIRRVRGMNRLRVESAPHLYFRHHQWFPPFLCTICGKMHTSLEWLLFRCEKKVPWRRELTATKGAWKISHRWHGISHNKFLMGYVLQFLCNIQFQMVNKPSNPTSNYRHALAPKLRTANPYLGGLAWTAKFEMAPQHWPRVCRCGMCASVVRGSYVG